MTSAIDGLVSGLDTTSLINSLMKVEAAPQTLLKSKSDAATKLVTALQTLNSQVASLATTAAKAASTTSWQAVTASSSSPAVTATTTSAAVPSSVQLRVDRLASGQVSMVDLSTASLGDPPTFTLVAGDELVTLTASGSDATALAAAINAAGVGVSAVPILVSDGGGTPQHRLQLTSETGAANAFEVYVGDEATVRGYLTDTGSGFVDNGTAPAGARLVASSAALVAAADAQVTFWPGATGSPLTATSATNVFEGVLPGVTFAVTATTTSDPAPVTLTVAKDADARRTLVSDTVTSLSAIFTAISAQTATTTTKDADGRTVVNGGLFSGESSIRFLTDNLRAAASSPVGGISPSTIGISVDRYGAVTFDAATFDAAMARDPAATESMAQAVAQRLADVADEASDSIDGTLTMRVKSEQGIVDDLMRQIEGWDRRLAIRRETLQAQYTALEVTLGNLQSQSSWLTSQLAGLDNLNASASSSE